MIEGVPWTRYRRVCASAWRTRGGDRERVEGACELFLVHAALGHEHSPDPLRATHIDAVFVDVLEHRHMHFREDVQLLRGVEGLGQGSQVTRCHGHSMEIDVVTLGQDPGVQDGFKLVAVDAAVGEHLHDLYLLGIPGLDGHRQFEVVLALPEFLRGDGHRHSQGDDSKRSGDKVHRFAFADDDPH